MKDIKTINDLVSITKDLSEVYIHNINYINNNYVFRGVSEDKILTNSELIFDKIISKYKIPLSDTKCQSAAYIFALATYVGYVGIQADNKYKKSNGKCKSISLGKITDKEIDYLIDTVLPNVKPYNDWVTELLDRIKGEEL